MKTKNKTGNHPQAGKHGEKKNKTVQVHHHTKYNSKDSSSRKNGVSSEPLKNRGSSDSNGSQLSALQQKLKDKLEGARFRTINEELYTTTGEEAFETFSRDPSKFHVYHSGYRIQAQSWPCNPLDYVIQWIQENHPASVVADMGCGEARLAASISNVVHSFDLVAANDRVVACNMAAVPLPDSSVDVVVFCLSLMGTNLNEFLRESFRILKQNGILKIIEVRSRFEDGKGIKRFLQYLKSTQGFQLVPLSTNESNSNLLDNKMFFTVECRKISNRGNFASNFDLKPCVYKKR